MGGVHGVLLHGRVLSTGGPQLAPGQRQPHLSQLLKHLPALPGTTRPTHVPNLEPGLSYQRPVDFEPLVHEQVVAVVAEHDIIDAVGKSQRAQDGIHKRPAVIGIQTRMGRC